MRLLKRQCRRTERKWKKDKSPDSQKSNVIWPSCCQKWQFSTSHNLSPPRIFFETIHSVISRSLPPPLLNALKRQEFLNYFTNKISESGQFIPPDSRETDIYSCPTSHLTRFHQISLQTLSATVGVLNSSTYTADCLPMWFLKGVIETGDLDILVIVNRSLSTGVSLLILNMPLYIPFLGNLPSTLMFSAIFNRYPTHHFYPTL